MSIILMAAVWPLAIPLNEKIVLLSLADHAKDDGVCWPSISRLCVRCSLSVREIQKCLAVIESKRLIQRNFRSGRATSYQITLPTHNIHPPVDNSVDNSALPPSNRHPSELLPPSNGHPPPSNGHPHPRPMDTQNCNLNLKRIKESIFLEKLVEERVVTTEIEELLESIYKGMAEQY